MVRAELHPYLSRNLCQPLITEKDNHLGSTGRKASDFTSVLSNHLKNIREPILILKDAAKKVKHDVSPTGEAIEALGERKGVTLLRAKLS